MPGVLRAALTRFPDVELKVAYSGGRDSHVLLHSLVALRHEHGFRLAAVHINHGLHPAARQWMSHCAQVCAQLDVPLHAEEIQVRPHGEGLEAAARRTRYTALEKHVGEGAALLTAHHQDDQAETVLLQLLRGAGVHGLAAMPVAARFGNGVHVRPLLGFRRIALEVYARAQGIRWVEDSSNLDTRLARNYMRHRLIPMLEQHWPAAVACLARSSRHVAEAGAVMDEIGAEDMRRCAGHNSELDVRLLERLSHARRRNVVRTLIREALGNAPPAHLLEEIVAQLDREPATRHALVRVGGGEVRRYRDRLVVRADKRPSATGEFIPWQAPQSLLVPGTGMRLWAVETVGSGLSIARVAGRQIEIRMRSGGERIRLSGSGGRSRLKKILQSQHYAPWERAQLPLVYVEGVLAAVADAWIATEFAAKPREPGWLVRIERAGGG